MLPINPIAVSIFEVIQSGMCLHKNWIALASKVFREGLFVCVDFASDYNLIGSPYSQMKGKDTTIVCNIFTQ